MNQTVERIIEKMLKDIHGALPQCAEHERALVEMFVSDFLQLWDVAAADAHLLEDAD